MRFKISEKRLFLSVIFFAAGLYLLLTTKLTAAPVTFSEAGLVLMFAALVFILAGLRLASRAVQKS